MTGKIIALLVLAAAMISLAVHIEHTARPISDKAGIGMGEEGHDDH